MIRNYLKIALRSFRRQKSYTFLNVIGLSLGMAASLLIIQYVKYERSFDTFHSRAKDTLIGIASLISLPLIYFSAAAWLKNYPLRVNFPLVAFLVPIAIISLLVVLTSCFQTIKAALTTSVNYLKNE